MARKTKVFRPYLDDVERLSYGKGAKKQRGTGSRMVCHRLNRDERKIYDFAKEKDPSFIAVRGTGYRKNRKGSPLCNIFRQRCDALEELCVIIEKRADLDRVVIDFSTLRVRNDDVFVTAILENVLRAKYFDLYAEVMKDHHHNVAVVSSSSSSDSGNENSVLSSIIRTPIHWETVRTKAIWGVEERLITIPCERGVAKSLAIDVLKESHNFSFDHVDDVDNDDEEKEEEVIIPDEQSKMLSEFGDNALTERNIADDADEAVDDDDDNFGIDWDDI
mmetsp:Transcript_61306/g.181284  ORF Transcript_61306/g.181284 Transcript_61306/m.181284 type:complete len:276 (-) Transcript_61306:22-849(-)